MNLTRLVFRGFASTFLFCLLVAPGHAANIEKRILEINIESDGSVLEKTTLSVLLETATDIEEWASYPIYLDANRELVSVDARVIHPDQSVDKVRSRDQETVEGVGSSTHSSEKVHLLEFRGLRPGSRLKIIFQVRERPYFPGGLVGILRDDPTSFLRIEVRRPGGEIRYHLEGVNPELQVRQVEWGIVFEARDLPAYEESAGPSTGDISERGSFRYAWGPHHDWADLGSWYEEILRSVPLASQEVSDFSDLLTEGKTSREALLSLIDYVQSEIRYVAVEVGIGGYRPSSPADVFERRWGDCKDKALLFIQLLNVAGIKAYPVLIRLDSHRRIDRDFPSPWGFNHMIVAVEMDGIERLAKDPIAEDLFFVDTTQTRGKLSWLNPWVQGREALVVGEGFNRLVTMPVQEVNERTTISIEIEEASTEVARAKLAYETTGSAASAFIDQIESQEGQRKALGYRIIDRVVPGASSEELLWDYQVEQLPTARFRAEVIFPTPREQRNSLGLKPPNFKIIPDPKSLAEQESSVALIPEILEVKWEAPLPTGCVPAEGQDRFVEKPGVSFRQKVTSPTMGRIRIERVTTISQRFFEMDELSNLHEVAVEEYRAQRRRVRLICEG